jgi:predicted Zn-dependent protease
MGHEVAHALARHAGERLSQGMLLEVAAAGLAVGVGDMTPASRDAILQAFGLGAQVGVILPFGRSQEAEADRIGLILMAKAGYDPAAALGLWDRFEETNKAAPPEFLSTHPSYGTRQENIRSWLPEARRYFRPEAAVQVVALPPLR